ncbi:hypothetical protein [Streptomyces sp. NPDC017988]|uniref:hypothetical protein n=1 Tax=Streptomyces sp. NPDC017988 TaxID=3365025 RepID=UPI0037AF95BA
MNGSAKAGYEDAAILLTLACETGKSPQAREAAVSHYVSGLSRERAAFALGAMALLMSRLFEDIERLDDHPDRSPFTRELLCRMAGMLQALQPPTN